MEIDKIIKKIEISVPGKDVKITIKDELSWYEFLESQKIRDAEARGIFVMAKMITGWNITGEGKKVLEITEENIKSLPVSIILPVLGKVNELVLSKTEKKKR